MYSFGSKQILSLCVLGFSISATHLYAQCDRTDVDHYLSKGFTPEQVTALCSSPAQTQAETSVSKKNLPSSSAKTVQPQPSYQANAVWQDVLWQSLKVKGGYLTETDLHFTRKVCLDFGAENRNGIRKKFCPILEYRIARQGMQVLGIEKQRLFSQKRILSLKGDLEIALSTTDENQIEQHKNLRKDLIDKYIAETKTLTIEVKPNVPEHVLLARLQEVALR